MDCEKQRLTATEWRENHPGIYGPNREGQMFWVVFIIAAPVLCHTHIIIRSETVRVLRQRINTANIFPAARKCQFSGFSRTWCGMCGAYCDAWRFPLKDKCEKKQSRWRTGRFPTFADKEPWKWRNLARSRRVFLNVRDVNNSWGACASEIYAILPVFWHFHIVASSWKSIGGYL